MAETIGKHFSYITSSCDLCVYSRELDDTCYREGGCNLSENEYYKTKEK